MVEHWQLDDSAPALYERYLVPRITALWAADLVQRAGLRPGDRVLDVACGTGAVARVAAERVGPTGAVSALDINPHMLATAQSLASRAGLAIDWHEGSALALPFADASFDAVLCQLGVQFFPDRPAAIREMRRVLRHGGRLAVSVYSAIERTPAAHGLADGLDRHLRPGASNIKRAEHVMTDAGELHGLLARAGFRDIVVNAVTQTIRFPSALEYVRLQLTATPMAALIKDLDAPAHDALIRRIADEVAVMPRVRQSADTFEFPQEAYVALGAA
ncbi:MAG TPA: class I SAM-dependent methyltransferase [Alphaproteobacteria bacterium]|nr:class I SAM-dependent methyltransferase [Alphaproteobacteria bacterium]